METHYSKAADSACTVPRLHTPTQGHIHTGTQGHIHIDTDTHYSKTGYEADSACRIPRLHTPYPTCMCAARNK
jgi:hypothetical protein